LHLVAGLRGQLGVFRVAAEMQRTTPRSAWFATSIKIAFTAS